MKLETNTATDSLQYKRQSPTVTTMYNNHWGIYYLTMDSTQQYWYSQASEHGL